MFNKNIKYYLMGILVLGLGVIYYRLDPGKDAFFLKCPFKMATGWDCPGCGSQRAFHELLHLNFMKSWRYNPLFVLLIPYVLLGFLFNLESVKRRFPKIRKVLFGKEAVYVLLIVVLVFFVFRNF